MLLCSDTAQAMAWRRIFQQVKEAKLQRLHHKMMAIKVLCDKSVVLEIVFVSKYTPDNCI
jgi:hypothetical protein